MNFRPGCVIVVVVVIGLLVFVFWPRPVQRACDLARLPYPPGKVLHAKDLVNPFAGTAAFMFTAPKEDIQHWLGKCKELEPTQGVIYTPKHYLLTKSHQEIEQLRAKGKQFTFISILGSQDPIGDGFEVLSRSEGFPWFTPHITHGVRYYIQWDSSENYGSVFVDWDTNTVWVTGSHS